MAVQFVDEIPSRNRTSTFDADLQELREKPGVPAIIRTYENKSTAHSTAYQLRKKHNGEFEFSVRENKLYGEFLGTPEHEEVVWDVSDPLNPQRKTIRT